MNGSQKRGVGLIERIISEVRDGSTELSIAVAEPVPKGVLATLRIAPKIPLSPSMRRWLAFDGGWVARTLGWLDEAAAPSFSPAPIDELVYRHISKEFARYFERLPGKLAGVRALPLDIGAESMRVLALVPGKDGEYPVLDIDVDDSPSLTVRAPGFDVWLACRAGLVDDAFAAYESDIRAIAKPFLGKAISAILDIPERDGEARFEKRMQSALAKSRVEPKKKAGESAAIVVPKLGESGLGVAIAEAIEGKREERAQAFIAAASERFPNGKAWRKAALIAAVRADDTSATASLLDAGADPNTTFGAGETALHVACGDKRVATARLLIARGADVNALDRTKRAPLARAVSVFRLKRDEELPAAESIAKLLLEAGAKPSLGAESPLHLAIGDRHDALAEMIVRHGADPDGVNRDEESALQFAYRHRAFGAFDLLARKGGRRDRKNKQGWSLADVIAGDGHLPAVFDVRLECSEEPQRVCLTLGFLHMRERPAHEIEAPLSALVASADAGLLGSDVFAPSAGRGKIEKKLAIKRLTGSKGKHTEALIQVAGVLNLGGVSPAGLAHWIRGLTKDWNARLAYLSINGESALGQSALSVDTKRASTWLADPRLEPLKPRPKASIAITDAHSPGVLCRIELGRGEKAIKLKAFTAGIDATLAAVVPAGVTDLRDTMSMLGRGTLDIPYPEKTPEGFVYRYSVSPEGALPANPIMARALFESAMERLATEARVASAEWSYGVERVRETPSIEGFPYVEVAKTGRSACMTCEAPIEKDALRIAVARIIESPEGVFVRPGYLHVQCAKARADVTLSSLKKNTRSFAKAAWEAVRRSLE